MIDVMYDWFSTREIATIIYIVLFILFIIINKTARSSFVKVVDCACKVKLVIPFLILVFYGAALTLLLSKLSVWDNVYIKDIALWVILVGIPYCFNTASAGNTDLGFRHLILNNLKICVILEFFIGTFTFELWKELLLLPFVTLIVVLHAVSTTKDERAPVTKFLDCIMALIGFIVLGCTMKAALGMYKMIDPVDVLVSFCVPIIFSVLFIPCTYLLAVYVRYDSLFARMRIIQSDNEKTRRHRRYKIIRLCGLSYKNIGLFNREYVRKMYIGMADKDFDEIVNSFKIIKRRR